MKEQTRKSLPTGTGRQQGILFLLGSAQLRIQTKACVPNLGLGFKVEVQISGNEHKIWWGVNIIRTKLM